MLFGADLVLRNPTLCPIWGFRYLDYVKGDILEKYGATRMPLMFTPGHKVSLNDTMWIMRTHFEGAATLFHHFWTISRAFLSPTSPHTRRGLRSTWCPC